MIQDHHLGGADSTVGTWMPDVWEELVNRFNLRSVIDVGCGTGINTKWFLDRGLKAIGIEGHPPYIDASPMPYGSIVCHDFTLGPYSQETIFDLGWSSEFVEHVEEKFIPNFMAVFQKCRYVCITFATPGQGGFHHVNENTTEYWEAKFLEFDLIHIPRETEWMRATGPNTFYGRRTLTFFKNQKHQHENIL